MAQRKTWAAISDELTGEGEIELLRAELADERERVGQLEQAIVAHQRAILERVPQKSGRQIDEALWWWIQ